MHCSWPYGWKSKEGLPIQRRLHVPFSQKSFDLLIPAVSSHPERLELSCNVVWERFGAMNFRHPLKSVYERENEGFVVSFDSQILSDFEAQRGRLERAVRSVLQVWQSEELAISTADHFRFVSEHTSAPKGKIFTSNDLLTERRADSLSYWDINDREFASELAVQTLDALVKAFGKPHLRELTVESFSEEAEACAAFCHSLAPNWYMELLSRREQKV
jgi:hypothetical protein